MPASELQEWELGNAVIDQTRLNSSIERLDPSIAAPPAGNPRLRIKD